MSQPKALSTIKTLAERLLCFGSLFVILASICGSTAVAMSPDQLKLFHENINYYDVDVCGEASTSGATPITAGTGSPTGLQFPNLDPSAMADAINTYVKNTNPSSKLNNLGATLVASAKNADINPFLVVAIAQQESNLSNPSDYNVSHGNNSFGRTAASGQPSFSGARTWYYWPSVKASIDFTDQVNQKGSNSDEPQFLVDEYGSYIKNNDLPGLVKKYDPNPSEYKKYIPDVTNWIKQMADLAGGSAGQSGAGAAGASGGQAGSSGSGGSSSSGGSGAPTIVLDPGHAPKANEAVDPSTKLPVFDYENDPEMKQMWQVAQDVQSKLQKDGYTVLLTKKSLNDSSTNLKQRAEVANNAHASLAVSLHSTPAPGNTIIYPAVGDYVATTSGKHDVYNNSRLAGMDKQYSDTMAKALGQSEGQQWKTGTYTGLYHSTITRQQGGVTMTGSMLTTPYFAKVPWVYVEQEQDASGASVSSGLLSKYEDGVVKGIEQIVPSSGSSQSSSSSNNTCCPPSNSSDTSGGNLSGNSNSEKAYNFFVSNGFTPFQSAAIVGNLTQESGVNPKSGDQSAGGIAGFTSPPVSMSDMESWVRSHSEDPMSLKGQLDFLLWYVTKSSPSIGDSVKKTTSLHDASYAWLDNFERCANYNTDPTGYACYENKRIHYGETVLQQFGNGAADNGGPSSAPGGGTVSCANPTASPNCQAVTGDANILCEAKQYDPVSYVWGGGHSGGAAYHNACKNIGSSSGCGLDCSGLVSIAVYDAFKVDLPETTNAEASDSQHWKHVKLSDVQPGDLIQPDPGHVEIVDHVSGGRVYTFGAHTSSVPQPDQVGPASFPADSGYVYLHWVGQGS